MTGRLVLFAGGSEHPYTDPRTQRQSFAELWSFLAKKCGAHRKPRVVGFSKGNVVALNPPRGWGGLREPLDVLIAREYASAPFDWMVIAFDAQPKQDGTRHRCWRIEVRTLLNAFCRSEVLPKHLRKGAIALRKYYRMRPHDERTKGRPPRTAIEVLVMDPMFEDLLLEDEIGAGGGEVPGPRLHGSVEETSGAEAG